MAHGSSSRADQIFREAVELSLDDRDAFLAERCAGDAELRNSVERRLRDLVETELGAGSDRPREDRGQPEPVLGPEDSTIPDASPRETIPVRIGPYRILQGIGAGGMGTVYEAEQEEPIRRRVALKVIKRGMDTEQVLARFEAERQALALMDHPNIAKVFDAGETEHGLPYFVMELVKGEPITTFCDRHRLPIRERLELFVPVCHAVQHAHHKGVIHRDLKPSNILVAVSDDTSIPKIIDFGVAKATAAALTEKTLYTEQGQLVGTPAYMSPEQAEMGGLDVD
ncbi:MAG: serine/threonine-protein kinase, partial [bacterium]